MRRLIVALALLLGMLPAASPALAQDAPSCTFVLGFAALHDLIPATVGDCTDDEAHNPANGDALQHTTNGLLVWRKADNWTAFTDGYRTWVNGPSGLAERLNSQRFPWEANPDGLPVVAGSGSVVPAAPPAAVAPAPAPAATGECVANVAASVKYPQLGGGQQTLYVAATDASGNAVPGALGSAHIQYSTTSRDLALPPTDTSGDSAVRWYVGGPRGTVSITVTEQAGGCTATGATSFQGR